MGNNTNDLTINQKKALILALSKMYGDIFDISRVHIQRLKNRAIYSIESKDDDWTATIAFNENDDQNYTKILGDICKIIIADKDYSHLSKFDTNKEEQVVSTAKDIINEAIKAIGNPTKNFIGPTGDAELDNDYNPYFSLFTNCYNGSGDLARCSNSANIITGEFDALSTASALLQKCYTSRRIILNMKAELNEIEKTSEAYQYLISGNTNWRNFPEMEELDKETEKLKAKLLTIAIASDKFSISLTNEPAFDNELCLNYTHKKSFRLEREYLHSRKSSPQDTKNFRHNLYKQINRADILYWLFGKNSEFLTKQKEKSILKNLTHSTSVRDLIQYLSSQEVLQTANFKGSTDIINALILNFATLEGIGVDSSKIIGNKEFESLSKREKGKVLSQIFDNNYDIAKTNKKLVFEVVRKVNQPEYQR